MQAMQYEITLPTDYDMTIIRHRVATRGATTDAFDGLGLKAYAIREHGVDGSAVNQYAPFYLWTLTDAMNAFLWGGPFGVLSGDFGRPVVQQWTGLAFERGAAYATAPNVATRRTQRIAPDADASAAIAAARADARERARAAGVHSACLAIDTRAWELMQFTLWDAEQSGAATGELAYEVLHLSSPDIDELEVAQW
jgi:hypothetical protein